MTKGALDTGLSFARALAAKDHEALRAILVEDLDFRALTPNVAWREKTAEGFLKNVVPEWYGDDDHIEELVEVHVQPIAAGRCRMSYEFRVRNPDGLHIVHQDAYFETDDGQITWLRIACAGYLPV